MASLNQCSVCFDEFGSGEQCPKLLPCSHTICLECLEELVEGARVKCPVCRAKHQVPQRNVENFPTNRYVLEILELEEKVAKKDENVFCKEHGKTCVMFCAKCWLFLCLECPTAAHLKHNRMSLADNLHDVKELDEMKEEVENEKTILDEYREKINQSEKAVDEKAKEAEEAVMQSLEVIKEEAKKIKEDIRKKSKEQKEKLEAIRQSFENKIDRGQGIKDKITTRKDTTLSQSTQYLGNIMEELTEFKKSAKEERNKTTIYYEIGFEKAENRGVYSNPLGKIVTSKKVLRQSGTPLELPNTREESIPQAAAMASNFDINDIDDYDIDYTVRPRSRVCSNSDTDDQSDSESLDDFIC